MAAPDPTKPLLPQETNPSGLELAGWGFASVLVFVAAFASWQFAGPRFNQPGATSVAQTATRADPAEATGSIRTPVIPTAAVPTAAPRVVGGAWTAPSPNQTFDGSVTQKEVEALRQEIRELRRMVIETSAANEVVVRRLSELESIKPEQRAAAAVTPVAPAAPRPTSQAVIQPVMPVLLPAANAAGGVLQGTQPQPPQAATKAQDAAPQPSAEADDDPADVTVAARTPSPTAAPVKLAAIAKTEPAKPETAPFDSGVGQIRVAPTGPAAVAAPSPTAAPVAKPETTVIKSVAVTPNPAPLAPQATDPALASRPTMAFSLRPQLPAQAQAPAPATTGSIGETAKPVDPTVAAAKPADVAPRTDFAVDLGSYKSLATLRKAWVDFSTKLPDLAKGLSPLASIKETEDGVELRLVAGPFFNAADATRHCVRLKQAGLACTAAAYSGQAVVAAR